MMPNATNTPRQLLLTYLRPQKSATALLILLVLSTLTLQLINPQVMRTFIDGAESGRPLDELMQIAGLFILLAVIRQVSQLASSYVGEDVAWTATNALRADLALHCLKLDMGFHKAHKPGELIERVDGDINQLATFFSQLVIQLSANLILCSGALVLLWLSDWTIGLTITLIAFCSLIVTRSLSARAIPLVEALREIEATLYGYAEEWLHGTETIRSNSAETYILQRLSHLLRERWHRSDASMQLTTMLNAVPHSVFALAYITAFSVGAWRFFDGRISIGFLYITFYYIDLLRMPLWQLTRQIKQLQHALASINRINALFAKQPTIVEKAQPTHLAVAEQGLRVQFDALSFAYADEPETLILDKINFTLAPNKVLGLLGRTGSGKTTLSKLLIRFYDPSSGAILLGPNGAQVDLRDVAHSNLRRQIGMVTQKVQLFNASVRDNLTLFDAQFTDEQITAALHMVGLDRWLAELPNGLDSHLAADDGLSAGEAQLLAFTRVFLADPRLIILDEASSRLDPATEQLIEKALDKLLHNRTVIIIAHRLATVNRADEIMILRKGEMIEHGPRKQLMANPDSHFAHLLQTGLTEGSA
ncbi:MAG: ABC transporter ATP-binding protein [Candidatus Promineifilaceae bacterium]